MERLMEQASALDQTSSSTDKDSETATPTKGDGDSEEASTPIMARNRRESREEENTPTKVLDVAKKC